MRRRSLFALLPLAVIVSGACAPSANEQPTCRSDSPTLLMAESVQSASLIPCVDALPQGWTWQNFEADESNARFSLDQQDGDGVLEVELLSSCEVTGPGEPIGGFPTARRYRSVNNGGASIVWTSTFPGGCSRAALTFSAPPPQIEVERLERAISFLPRDQLRPV